MSVLAWRSFAGPVVALALIVCAAPARAASFHTAYVTNAAGTLILIDTATNTPGRSIPVALGSADVAEVIGLKPSVEAWVQPVAPDSKPGLVSSCAAVHVLVLGVKAAV